MLADLDDINTFLPTDKLEATDGNDAITRFQVDVDRIIKGNLSSVFTAATLAGWADPATTPVFIRSVAGRLIAAFWYSLRYSEQMPDWDRTYPQRLYNEALAMIEQVRSGTVIIVPGLVPGTQFDNSYFLPNNDTTPPFFTVDLVI